MGFTGLNILKQVGIRNFSDISSPPFKSDLLADYNSIVGIDYIDSIAGNDGEIMPRVADFNGVNDGVDSSVKAYENSIWVVKCKITESVTFKIQGGFVSGENTRLYFGTGDPITTLRYGWGSESSLNGTVLNGNDGNWHTYIMYDKRLWLKPITQEITDSAILDVINNDTPDINHSAATWSGTEGNFVYGNIGVQFIKNSMSVSYIGRITAGVITWGLKTIVTGQGDYEYDLSDNNNHGTWSGTGGRYDYSADGSTYAADNGYSLWEKAGSDNIQVPFSLAGVALSLTAGVDIPAGYTKTRDIVGSTKWNMADALVDMEYGNILQCDTAGVAYATQPDAYGLVFDGIINKGTEGGDYRLYLINSDLVNTVAGFYQGYIIRILNTEKIRLVESNGISSVSTLWETAASYLSINTDYRLLVWRNKTTDQYVTGAIGTFAVYIQGKNKTITTKEYTIPNLNEMELVDDSGGVGTNPVTNNTYTTSAYIVNDLDAGDKLSKINVNGKYISPYDFTVSSGVYSIIDNSVNAILRRSNATYQTAASRAAEDYDASNPYRYHVKEIADPRTYASFFQIGYKGMHFAKIQTILNGDVYDIVRLDENLIYGTDKITDEEWRVMKWANIDDYALKDGSGDYITDANGYVIINPSLEGRGSTASVTIYEDFTTYTEVDTGGHITVATNKLTGAVPETAESYVYKDFTADYFDGDYEMQFQMNVAATSEGASLGVLILANDLDDCRALDTSSKGAHIRVTGTTAVDWDLRLSLEWQGTSNNVNGLSYATDYYITVTRDDDAGANSKGRYVLSVYSDSGRTSLVGTATVDSSALQKDWRYLYPMSAYKIGDADVANVVIDNLEIISP